MTHSQSMTASMQRALKYASRNHGGLRCNSIDYGMLYGVTGAAFNAVVNALERRGFVSGPDATITDAGETYVRGLIE